MQRLTRHRGGRDPERGAVAVMFAICLAVLFAVAALVIDLGAAYADKQELQNGADAAALAAAQDCAAGRCDQRDATVTEMVTVNKLDGNATGQVAEIDEERGSITVTATSTRRNSFAALLGHDTTTVGARAVARWGYPVGANALLPVVFSWCDLQAQAGATVVYAEDGTTMTGLRLPAETELYTLRLRANSGNQQSGDQCVGPSGSVPGGFGWLKPTEEQCGVINTSIGGWVVSDPGANVPPTCTNDYFMSLTGRTILMPIFDVQEGGGNNAQYRIFGYASFRIEGYYFNKQHQHRPDSTQYQHIRGRFQNFVHLGDFTELDPGAPALGSSIVALVE